MLIISFYICMKINFRTRQYAVYAGSQYRRFFWTFHFIFMINFLYISSIINYQNEQKYNFQYTFWIRIKRVYSRHVGPKKGVKRWKTSSKQIFVFFLINIKSTMNNCSFHQKIFHSFSSKNFSQIKHYQTCYSR